MAVNPAYDLWISAQALSAIFTGNYYLPKYLQDKTTFTEMLSKHMETLKNSDAGKAAQHYLYERLLERIAKYKRRDLTVTWVESNKVLPWVENRFCYAVWKEDKEKNKL